jgi:hypothetical protein
MAVQEKQVNPVPKLEEEEPTSLTPDWYKETYISTL